MYNHGRASNHLLGNSIIRITSKKSDWFMKNIYEFLFYKFYLFFKFLGSDTASFSAILAVCWIIAVNLFSVFILFAISYPYLLEYTTLNNFISFGILILGFNYLYFLRKNRYQRMIKRYKEISNNLIVISTILTVTVVVFTFGIFFFYVVPLWSIYLDNK